MYQYDSWPLTLWEDHGLSVLVNRVLMKMFGHKRDEVAGEWQHYIMRSPTICTLHQILG
jgi:hypothetical protein